MSPICWLIGIYAFLTISGSIETTSVSKLDACSSEMGCVKGKYMGGYNSEKFVAFLGIPYAVPPVGDLRFRSPKAFPKFDEVYEATEPKTDCIQKNYLLPNRPVSGKEDCLYMNVYKPHAKSSSLLPVIVYIYGGGWFSGTSNPAVHGPEYFMDTNEVVFVIFNYRLGPFGFLSTNDENMPGNLGLKDQNLALQWVKRNIHAFGGDSTKVTLMGQSAGAVSAHMHMLSKQSEGLFRRVIALSGTANVPFAITEDPLQQTRKLANLCNISDADSLSTFKLADALRNIDPNTLLNAGDGLKYWDVDPLTNFRPIVESADILDAFLTQHPNKLIQTGQYTPVPWMINFTPNEGVVRGASILEQQNLFTEFNHTFDKQIEALMDLPTGVTEQKRMEIKSFISKTYFGNKHFINEENKSGLVDVISDRGFIAPMVDAIYKYVSIVDINKFPLFVSKFDYKGPYTFVNLFVGGVPSRDYGVGHCDELVYLFRMPAIFPDFPRGSTDMDVVQSFVGIIVEFAKNNNPATISTLKACQKIHRRSNDFCDFQEFTNSKKGSFIYKTLHSFDRSRVNKWNDLLNN